MEAVRCKSLVIFLETGDARSAWVEAARPCILGPVGSLHRAVCGVQKPEWMRAGQAESTGEPRIW